MVQELVLERVAEVLELDPAGEVVLVMDQTKSDMAE
jgi:hypothetical protein